MDEMASLCCFFFCSYFCTRQTTPTMYPSFFSCLSVLQVCLSATDSTIMLVERQLVYFCLFFFPNSSSVIFCLTPFLSLCEHLDVHCLVFTLFFGYRFIPFFFSSRQVLSLFMRLMSTAVHAGFRKGEKYMKIERKEKKNMMTMHWRRVMLAGAAWNLPHSGD